jgi:hypothetical protein
MIMAVAQVISITDPFEEFRKLAHEAVDNWIENLRDFFERGKQPTVTEISERFNETKHALLGQCFKGLLESLASDFLRQEYATCPDCGRLVRRKRIDKRKVSTIPGDFTLARPYFHCRDCGCGFHPLDEQLEIVQELHQLDIQEKIAALAADLPYERAVHHFTSLTGIEVSSHFGHETLNAIGEEATMEVVIPDREEIARRIKELSGGSSRTIMVLAADGAHMPTRPVGGRAEKRGPGQYKEAKGFRLYLLGPDERIIHIASWHQIKDVSEFEDDIALIASRIPQDKVKICLLGDGASWIWNLYKEYFPDGIEILDYYHCSEHVFETAFCQYGDTLDAREWAESVLIRLGLDMASSVIAGLKRMKPADEDAEKAISRLITYLGNNKHRFGYNEHKKQGCPIGSGGIESSNKFICHTRIKRSGAWWLKENCNAMLRVRCAIYNGTFKQVLENYKASKFNKSN